MRRFVWMLPLICFPTAGFATTAASLADRIVIDGFAVEYAADERVLDETTSFPEQRGDSRWGADSDVIAVDLTWDAFNIYIAASCNVYGGELMLLVEYEAGGVTSLQSLDPFRRNIALNRFAPNLIVVATRASRQAAVARVGAKTPLTFLDDDEVPTAFVQTASGGALEIELPWSLVSNVTGTLRVLALVTDGEGSGTGDAAPDPSALLETSKFAVAWLDNALEVRFDVNDDDVPDLGISPRDVVVPIVSDVAARRNSADIDVEVEHKSFAPDLGETSRFRVEPQGLEGPLSLYMSCRVYSVSGRLVRVLFDNETRNVGPGLTPTWDVWDGKDNSGRIVPGGVYILNVTTSLVRGGVADTKRVSVSVIR